MRSLDGLRADLARIDDTLAKLRTFEETPSARLMRAGIEDVRDDVAAELTEARRTRLVVTLAGAPVVRHEIRVDALTRVLHSLQEAVSAIGQALAGKATSRSSIPGPLRDRTSLSLATVFPGSFGAVLQGPRPVETDTEPLFDIPNDTSELLDDSLEKLLQVIDLAGANSVDDSSIVEEVLALGSRAFKHLNDLSSAVIDESMTAQLSWDAPTGRHRQTDLELTAANRLGDVLSRNKVSEEQEVHVGMLGTVSNIRNRVELATGDMVIQAQVTEEWVPYLGDFYDHYVEATFDVSVARSLANGSERRAYSLVDLRRVEPRS